MQYHHRLLWIIGVALLVGLWACQQVAFEDNGWEVTVNGVGSSSSPKATDLNGDGIKDIIIGAGGKEYTDTPYGVIALDGKTGEQLWTVSARNQVVGTPVLHDFSGDGVEDVLIGGRSGVLYLINGATGVKIWDYIKDDPSYDIIADTAFLNFYNPQLTPDIDGDGVVDVIAPFGGYTMACPTCTDRPQGYLLGISSATGEVILKMPMPDRKEIYMSPVLVDLNDGEGLRVLFGTGGEKISGGFYTILFDDFVARRYDQVKRYLIDEHKGYIAPPVVVDINADDVLDIIVNPVNGHINAIDGKRKSVIWEYDIGPGYEGYAMSSVGDYNGDGVLDVFCSYGYGPWPDTKFTRNLLLDSRDGTKLFTDSTGTFQYASPVAYDFNGDGVEEVLLAVNNPITTKFKNSFSEVKFLGNELRLYNLYNDHIAFLRPAKVGTNLGTTPLIIDLDDDGYLDIVSCYMTDSQNFYSFSSMVIERIELQARVNKPFNWNGYLGVNTNGVDLSAQ